MAVAAPAATQAPLLYRTAPFSLMEPARRFQLLWQSQAVHYSRGEEIFSSEDPPSHVLIIFEGEVSVFGELPAEPGPMMLDDVGPGGCVGWSAALTGVPGVCALATTDVDGLLIPAPAFFEITRYDLAIKEAVFSKAWKSEVWRAVLSEMDRRTGRMRSARSIVDSLLKEAVACDWPEDESRMSELEDYVWVVVGGEGAKHGDRWADGEGVLWARLIGLPEYRLNEGLIEVTAMETVEPEISPSRSDALLAPGSSKAAAVSASEVRRPPAETSRSHAAPKDAPVPRADRVWPRILVAFLLVACCSAGGVAWWASRQRVVQTVSFPGRMIFTGETRPLRASVVGSLTEINVRAGQRVQAGAILAVIRPLFDEARLRELELALARAKADAQASEAFLRGEALSETRVSLRIMDLFREHARASSDARVWTAIGRGGSDVAGMTLPERQRVATHFASQHSAADDQLDTAARDASTRGEDLREAEQAAREAQEEVRSHQQSFSGARSEDKKEAAQEIADYKRMLNVLTRQVSARQDSVNRLRREIQVLRAEATPAAAPRPPENGVELANARAALTAIETQLGATARAARQAISEKEDTIARLKADAAPRRIVARAPGLVSEVSPLDVGNQVQAETALAHLVTRETWQIECAIPPAQKERLEPGQRARIAYTDQAGKPGSALEPFVLTEGPTSRMRLQTTREEWRDGMPVEIETDIVSGSLLDQWLGRISRVL